MATLALSSESPTGLVPDHLDELDAAHKRALALWMRQKAGRDGARRWWPRRIRELPLEARIELATDRKKDLTWEVRELRRIRASAAYFTFQYGHFQAQQGPPIPIVPWPEQEDVMETFVRELRTIILKARQLGLTWLALHYAFHLLAFEGTTANAKVLALSKRQEDSTKLLLRCRRINELLPPFLRQREHSESRGSLTRFKLLGTPGFEGGAGELNSLPSTPSAARMETATLVILDEFSFIPNQQAGKTWTAVQETIGELGQLIAIFTGNGPAERPGDGQVAAKLWEKANSGGENLYPIFLPASTDPRRTEAWREKAIDNYIDDESFETENPETEEQALQGEPGIRPYPREGINAAEKLGRMYDRLLDDGKMPPPKSVKGELLALAWDWGEQTHGLIIWPLERGGIYVAPGEVVQAHGEPGDAALKMVEALRELAPWEGYKRNGRSPRRIAWRDIEDVRYDAAGIQSMRTAIKVLRRRREDLPTTKVPFGDYKHETMRHLRRLFRRAAQGRTTEVIAISPRNKVLLRQLRGLRLKDDESDDIEKLDDHGPDALIAGDAPIAQRWRRNVD